MNRPRIYLDHAATTPVLPEARDAMVEALERWANPSSPHGEGREAKAALERARAAIADALGWRHDVIFTSGASEAIGIAASRATVPGRHVGATEHDIVPHAMGEAAGVLPVGGDGLIDRAALTAALEAGPALVAIQQVNNEIGVIQPLGEMASEIRAAGSLLLADCAQGAGKIDLPDADFIALSAHKFGGPPGIGALLVRDLATLKAIGGQERGYRRGTQNLPAVAAMAAALAARAHRDAMPRLADLRDRLEAGAKAAGAIVIGEGAPRLPAISAIALPGASKDGLLIQLDLAGFAVSAGSACSSGKLKGSRVLAAMGLAPEVAGGALRISLGPQTREADIDAFVAAYAAIAARAQAA
ncbi:cysteine desulfurase family protein [Sphingomonas astaxanthinifaciens]|uniref:Cysteine desulfurase n=1 Tax=Sphingomonas astaxanthinifaciens DSM 22298 TaxID=1123267 RepID=A0ABQ5Z6Q2_9SPHN|nr:cysteine desulfurase family protein [Sphingomonas astaxanthinifaciens]GLR48433.1 aminotransferase [Sphingomonas astaxanthinifaciens DSM 22298]